MLNKHQNKKNKKHAQKMFAYIHIQTLQEHV